MSRFWILVFFLFSPALWAGDVSPAEPSPSQGKPAYRFRHPRVLFDQGHHNVHFLTTGFLPFAKIVEQDGYRVAPIVEPFTAATLGKADVLVVVNPRSAGREAPLPERGLPAFSPEECAAVEGWVKAGGSLLLVADHYPIGSATQRLANSFGTQMSNGWTIDPDFALPEMPNGESITYRRDQGRLGDHPILRGRNAEERIDVVETFSGQSLRGPSQATPLLLLSDRAQDELPPDHAQKISAAGRTQGLAFRHGKGRVVVIGEAQALTSLISDGTLTGFERPGNDNRQLVLNVMRWLSGKL